MTLLLCYSSNHGLGAPSTNVELPYECQVEPTFVGYAPYTANIPHLLEGLALTFRPSDYAFYLFCQTSCRHAKPWKDLDSGDSYCLFFPFSPEHLAHTVPTLKDERPDISISVHAKLREARDVSGSASALFLGGFSILDMDKVMIVSKLDKLCYHTYWETR